MSQKITAVACGYFCSFIYSAHDVQFTSRSLLELDLESSCLRRDRVQ